MKFFVLIFSEIRRIYASLPTCFPENSTMKMNKNEISNIYEIIYKHFTMFHTKFCPENINLPPSQIIFLICLLSILCQRNF